MVIDFDKFDTEEQQDNNLTYNVGDTLLCTVTVMSSEDFHSEIWTSDRLYIVVDVYNDSLKITSNSGVRQVNNRLLYDVFIKEGR